MSEFLNKNQLKKIGFFKIGKGCKISNKISCYKVKASLGDNVRIDDHVCLKGKISLKSNIHIARGCTLSGGNKGIFVDSYTNLSNYVQIFSMSDDYFMPFIPGGALSNANRNKFAKIHNKKVYIGKAVLVGAFSIILPGSILNNFSSTAAYSVIYRTIKEGFYHSNLYKKISLKRRNLKQMKMMYNKVSKVKK
tara:strand:- start:1198 stop:1776 length:579 start_codon:yes stop_codon:yes gene_type:complete